MSLSVIVLLLLVALSVSLRGFVSLSPTRDIPLSHSVIGEVTPCPCVTEAVAASREPQQYVQHKPEENVDLRIRPHITETIFFSMGCVIIGNIVTRISRCMQ